MLALKQLSQPQPSGVLKKIKELSAVVLLKVTTKDAPTIAMSIIELLQKKLEKLLNRVTPIISFYFCFTTHTLLIRATVRTCPIQQPYL